VSRGQNIHDLTRANLVLASSGVEKLRTDIGTVRVSTGVCLLWTLLVLILRFGIAHNYREIGG
jgi:hypothetical protein